MKRQVGLKSLSGYRKYARWWLKGVWRWEKGNGTLAAYHPPSQGHVRTQVVPSSVYTTSGKLHKDYTVYEDVKSILPIYIHVYPVRPCRDDLCEIIPSIWGAVARHDRSDLFIIACGQSHLFMNMLWSVMISCELSYLAVTVLLVWWCVST